jgi:fumarate hydratase class I
MKEINLPVKEEEIRRLKVGENVIINGVIVTARDMAHRYMVDHKPEFLKELLNGGMIYHCGPIMRKRGDLWQVIAAGPTTSIREEPYEADVIAYYKVRGIIGKGGMRERTLNALKEHGAVYLHATGGAAVTQAKAIKQVLEVYKLEEFGLPEALWVFKVQGFSAVVTMDSHGQSLHEKVLEHSAKIAKELIAT